VAVHPRTGRAYTREDLISVLQIRAKRYLQQRMALDGSSNEAGAPAP